jgi:hypothetical protein
MKQGQQGKQGYEPPRIRDYGRLTDITAGHTNGTVMDRHFPTQVHRPMTFS